MKRLLKKSELYFRDEMLSLHNGQSDNIITVYDNGKTIGKLEYSIYDDKPYINMIDVNTEYRRSGIATKLLKRLQDMFPGIPIEWGMMTEDGSALFKAVTEEVDDEHTIAKFKELEELKVKLSEIERKIDNVVDVGDEWNDTYDRIRILENELYDKSPTVRFIK